MQTFTLIFSFSKFNKNIFLHFFFFFLLITFQFLLPLGPFRKPFLPQVNLGIDNLVDQKINFRQKNKQTNKNQRKAHGFYFSF